MAHIVFGIILILLGLSAIFGGWVFKLVFAALLIALGIKIIIAPKRSYHHCEWQCRTEKMEASIQETLNETIILGSLCKKIETDNFNGGKVTTIFGGGVLDLRDTKTTEKIITLEIITVFGGLKIFVPHNWTVNIQNTAVLGGCDNQTQTKIGDVTLKITGTVVLGGVQIIN